LDDKENPEQISTQFVTVNSVDDYIGKAQQLGAKVIKNKKEISEGYFAVLEDPQKNTFGIWQNK
jgi:predicted enzyme related to lactoylglutathione lyase